MHKFFDKLNEDIIKIREEVFIKEQEFNNEFDEIDENSLLILYYYNENPVATARLYEDLENKNEYFIGRVAVLKDYRKYGIGKEIIEILEEKVIKLGGNKIKLSAQKEVERFYKKCGFRRIGDIYYDEWCPHIKMVKDL
ncbi:GNAT family N-acetyltransferase [Miniphocaeibacter halophilus]|uniref:GNAT family N-acetyltransferase n=1 Tax=Miniphocaeibacter halophilus TaxID=2931922 RepID=A0AC61MQ17_9FIRM|nr:GNAT family N-acetyltransferase [Miniphocaeibacter halophilus]QQK07408.1 GNAT family N-acetyltransferase [Miniphocaeibacter halophilus]